MAKIEIKEEMLPQRCDICHQADCFDPFTNQCSRCIQSIDLIKPQSNMAAMMGKVTIDLQFEPNELAKAQFSLNSRVSIVRHILCWIIIIGGALVLYSIFHTPYQPPNQELPIPPDRGSTSFWVTISVSQLVYGKLLLNIKDLASLSTIHQLGN